MVSATTFPRSAASPRRRLLVFPREHGAWGMLFIPLATGALVALHHAAPLLPLLLLVVAAFALFCLRTPLEALLGTSPMRVHGEAEHSLASTWAMIYASAAALALSQLIQLGYGRGLLELGAFVAAALAVQLVLRKLGRHFRMAAQIAGAAGLTATAAAACYVVSGRLDRTALALWLMSFAFAAGQVHYVQVRIRHPHQDNFFDRLESAPGFFLGQLLLLIAVAFAVDAGFLPLAAIVALLPGILRGFYWFFDDARPLDVRRLGFHELAHNLAFGLLLVLAFRLW